MLFLCGVCSELYWSNTEPINAMATWMDYPKVILTIAMIIGMAAGSTTGALKLIRVITLFKGVY